MAGKTSTHYVCFCVSLLIFSLSLSAQGTLESAISGKDIALKKCQVTVNGKKIPLNENALLGTLGLGRFRQGWMASRDYLPNDSRIEYRIALNKPFPVGTVLCRQVNEIYALKPGKNIDSPATDSNSWQKLDFNPVTNGPLKIVTMPNKFETNGFLFIQAVPRKYSNRGLSYVRLLKSRYANITPLAMAKAREEFTQTYRFSPPTPYTADNIVKGKSRWQNTGLSGRDKKIRRPPISEFNPASFVIAWPESEEISGVYLDSNICAFNLYRFTGPDSIHPAVGTDKEWQRVSKFRTLNIFGREEESLKSEKDNVFKRSDTVETFVLFDKPVKTKGLKLLITKTEALTHYQTDQMVCLYSLTTLAPIGDKPVPSVQSGPEEPPYTITLDIPLDGVGTFVIDDDKGNRVCNLMARRSLKKGKQSIHWDLKKINKQMVPPGKYKVKSIFSEPLRLRYELSCYPNVTTNHPNTNTPWRNGHSGRGGWLADHTPPRTVCTFGDRLFFGAPCCESGEAFIECDLTGKRLWGHGNFLAWTGPKYMTANKDSVFVATPLKEAKEEGLFVETIFAVDPAKKSSRIWKEIPEKSDRKRAVAGIACDDKNIYLSTCRKDNYLENAVPANIVDLEHCLPKYKKKEKAHDDQDVADARMEFVRLFRIKGTPPGQYKVMKRLLSTSYPAARQHIVLALSKPAAIGTLIFPFPDKMDYSLTFSMLKEDAPYPPDPENDKNWIQFYRGQGKGWTAVALPPKAKTRALRISFDKRDEFDISLEKNTKKNDDGLALKDDDAELNDYKPWQGALDGMKLLKRRLKTLAETAKIRVNSGKVDKIGVWNAQRQEPISPEKPAIYAMEWQKPQKIRGLAIKEIDCKKVEIDVYTGPDQGPININSSKDWETITSLEPKRRYFYQPDVNRNNEAIYIDSYVDLGREIKTRAVRLRVVEQWTTKAEGRAGLYGIREDRGGMTLDPTRCFVYGVAPLEYIGGELEIDPIQFERLEVYDIKSRKLKHEFYVKQPGKLARSATGRLVITSENKIFDVNPGTGEMKLFTDDVKHPDGLGFDKDGNLYVFDRDPERLNVRVYDSSGKMLRTIGTPGGIKIGKWDPTRFAFDESTPVDLAVDKNNHMWVVEQQTVPKRISEWTTDGKFVRDFLGNTRYGGGGCLDPYDKTRLYYAANQGTLEFKLNWQDGTTELNKILWKGPDHGGEYPVKFRDRLYLTTRPQIKAFQRCGLVYLYEKDRIRPVAAMGLATNCKLLRTKEILESLGTKTLNELQFHWSDLNGDGIAQVKEVAFQPARIQGVCYFNKNLDIMAGNSIYRVTRILPNGVPVYEHVALNELPNDSGIKLSGDKYLMFLGTGHGSRYNAEAEYTSKGNMIWEYPNEGWSVHAITKAGPMTPEQVVSEFNMIGMAEASNKNGLGQFFLTNSNIGRWNVWTTDGLLVSEVMLDRRDRRLVSWSMPTYQRGMDLTNLTPGSEHFSGYFCKTLKDGKYYLVAGHNHISVLEILGLDAFQRFEKTISITKEDLNKNLEWEQNLKAKEVFREARHITCNKRKSAIRIDGHVNEWDFVSTKIGDNIEFSITYDEKDLYVMFKVMRKGPFKNTGNDFRTLFKTGAAVDLQIGTDPNASPARKNPAVGDKRILISMFKGKPTVVLYEPNAPGASKDEAWETHTMVFKTAFDRVKIMDKIVAKVADIEGGYAVEAKIPLKEIGLTIKPETRLKMDCGVLVTNPNGTEVLERIYWANKNTMILADVAAEARIRPALWGMITFLGKKKTMLDKVNTGDVLSGEGTSDEDVMKLLEE